jgi:hypothetical protein
MTGAGPTARGPAQPDEAHSLENRRALAPTQQVK